MTSIIFGIRFIHGQSLRKILLIRRRLAILIQLFPVLLPDTCRLRSYSQEMLKPLSIKAIRFPAPLPSSDFMLERERLVEQVVPRRILDLAFSFQNDMVDVSLASFTNFTNKTSGRGDTADVPPVAGAIIIIIINTITFPCTVVLNALVIKAVKTTPRLRTNSNILLACLAVTDALTGLLGQPLFVLWKIFLLVGLSDSKIVENCNYAIVVITLTASFFHLMFVTFERLIAIKFTMQYSNIITDNSMKRAVLVAWIISFIFGVFDVIEWDLVLRSLSGVLTASCIIFLSVAYFIMYRETRRHQEKIKTQQMPQEEVERFTKENKALKTTLYVVGAVFVCLLPLCFCLIVIATGLSESCPIDLSLMQTCAMLNSFVNPLIYCWRQKEMRQVIFGIRPAVVHIHNQ